MEIEKVLQVIIKQTLEQQNQLLRYYSKLPLESKVNIMEIKRKLFYKIHQNNSVTPIGVLLYAALILSIEKFKDEISEIDKNTLEIRSKEFRKQPKREKLISYWALVKSLKNDKDLSFRQISTYLEKYHKFRVAHSVIYELWQIFEIKNKEIIGE